MNRIMCNALLLLGITCAAQGVAIAQEESIPAKPAQEQPQAQAPTPAEAPKSASPASPASQVVSPAGYPISEIDRPLVLPSLVLEPMVGLLTDFLPGPNWVGVPMGVALGVMDNMEFGLQLPWAFAPSWKFGTMDVYGAYEMPPMLDKRLRLAGKLDVFVPLSHSYPSAHGGSDFSLLLSGLAKLKVHDMVAPVGGIGLGFAVNPGYFLLNLDLGLMVQPIEPLSISFLLGVHNYLGDNSHTAAPLYLRGQYVLMGELDLYVEFGFVDLSDSGADWVQLLVGAAFRFEL